MWNEALKLLSLGWFLTQRGWACDIYMNWKQELLWLEARYEKEDYLFDFQIWVNPDGDYGIGGVDISKKYYKDKNKKVWDWEHIYSETMNGLPSSSSKEGVLEDLESIIEEYLKELEKQQLELKD